MHSSQPQNWPPLASPQDKVTVKQFPQLSKNSIASPYVSTSIGRNVGTLKDRRLNLEKEENTGGVKQPAAVVKEEKKENKRKFQYMDTIDKQCITTPRGSPLHLLSMEQDGTVNDISKLPKLVKQVKQEPKRVIIDTAILKSLISCKYCSSLDVSTQFKYKGKGM